MALAVHAFLLGYAVTPGIPDKSWSADAVTAFLSLQLGHQVRSAIFISPFIAGRWLFKAAARRGPRYCAYKFKEYGGQ